MTFPYKIDTKEDLFKLSELACKENFPVYIATQYGQIDARSILGLFTILGKNIHLVAPDHTSVEEFNKFLNRLQK